MLKVVIDPGHYANYNKGVVAGYYEGNVAFNLAQYLKEELEISKSQIEVIMTKNTLAENPGVFARGQVAVSNKATILLSLHSNAIGDTAKYEQAYGVSVYRSLFLPSSEELGKRLADAIVEVMAPETGVTYSRGVLTRKSDTTGKDYYGVVRGAVNSSGTIAQASAGSVKHAFIIEHGFHTNSRECAFLAVDDNLKKIAKAEADVIKEYFGIISRDISNHTGLTIMGEATATETQLLAYLKENNQDPEFLDLPCLYLEEGKSEGVRGDAAFCMACKETGFFKFGGDVKKAQNNFCGLGATGKGNPGLSFETHRLGVRANIQHLKAYGSTEPLANECIDPRFQYISRGAASTFEDLAGKWAVPGYDTKKYISLEAARAAADAYGDNIAAMLRKALTYGELEVTQEIKPGDTVKVIRNITYTGNRFRLYYDKYNVLSISGDRAVIGIGKIVTAAINVKDIVAV